MELSGPDRASGTLYCKGFYGAEVGVNPLGLPAAEWPARHDGWGTVPERWATWQRFWVEAP